MGPIAGAISQPANCPFHLSFSCSCLDEIGRHKAMIVRVKESPKMPEEILFTDPWPCALFFPDCTLFARNDIMDVPSLTRAHSRTLKHQLDDPKIHPSSRRLSQKVRIKTPMKYTSSCWEELCLRSLGSTISVWDDEKEGGPDSEIFDEPNVQAHTGGYELVRGLARLSKCGAENKL